QEKKDRRISADAIAPLAIACQRQRDVAQQCRLAVTGRADDGQRQRVVILATLDAQELPNRAIAGKLAAGDEVYVRAERVARRRDAQVDEDFFQLQRIGVEEPEAANVEDA